MKIKRFISGLLALAVSASVFVVPASADTLPSENKSSGFFELKNSDETPTYYTVKSQKTSGDKNKDLEIKITDYSSQRLDIVDYKNDEPDDAKFVHTRFLVSVQKDTSNSEDLLNELRLIHYVKGDAVLRFNIDATDNIGIFDGEDKMRGYHKEYTWQTSTTKAPIYNKIDLIENCQTGAIYFFINDKLNAYSTEGSTDGKFYGYTFSKNENSWEAGDILTIGFDDDRLGHTIYKDTTSKKITIDDVLKDADIDVSALEPYRTEIDDNVKYVQSGGMYTHKQKEPILVTGSGTCIQCEEGSYTNDFGLTTDRNAADVKALKTKSSTSKSSIPQSEPAQYDLKFEVEEKANYGVWIRLFAPDKRSDSIFWAFGNNAYKQQDLDEEKYYWLQLYTGQLQPGKEYEVRICYREPNNMLDCILVTRVPGFTPSGRYGNMPENLEIKVDPLDENRYDNPPITPPANTHPRVMFTAKDIPQIRANMESPMNAAVMEDYNKLLSEEIDMEATSYSISNMERIQCYALEYVLNGDVERGKLAKQGIITDLENMSFDINSIESGTRSAGHAIHTAAKVYDWCYDLFNAAERDRLIVGCISLANNLEMKWPPTSQGVLTSHGAEAQLLRDYLSLAIAVYDERPDFWDFIGGRYFQQYIPIRQTYNTVLYQGSDYGIYRQVWNAYSFMLIKGMGYDFPIDTEKYYNDCMWSIYYRRPDGQIMRNGDISFGDKTEMWKYWKVYTQNWIDDAYIGKNPYSKLEYARQTPEMNEWADTKNNYTAVVDVLIMNQADLEPAKTFDDLPYSKFFGTPNGVMVARTGWEDGADSPTVVAEMKLQEYQINGHMHLDAGAFQIYYKGMLACDSGVYQGLVNSTLGDGASAFGSEHFNQYQTKTVAHNCMLVYDPSEATGGSGRGAINDGGQRAINNGNELGGSGVVSEDAHVATTQGMEIDPKNPHKPKYSYLKGDLTNAYSAKVPDYKRSFMFLNLDNEQVPAALIVFDKIDSSSISYKKTWLLHGLEEPEINGSRTVFKRTYTSPIRPTGYNGKLTVDTLLPRSSNIQKVGGDEMGYFTVNGKNYDAKPFKSQTDEGKTWRIEVSPQSGALTDYFLNVMQVSDADKENYLPVELVESELFYGAKISDRVVTFSKSAKRVGSNFSIKVSGSGDYQYTLCDIEAGTYSVSVGGKTQLVKATEEGGVLAFTAPAGTVSVSKSDKELTEDTAPVEEFISKRPDNAVSVKIDGVFVYHPVPAVLEDCSIMIDAAQLKKDFKLATAEKDGTITLKNKDKEITFTDGSDIAVYNGEEQTMSAAARKQDGVWMVPVRAAIEAMGGTVDWDRWANTLVVGAPPQDLTLPSKGYVKIIKVKDDGGEIDKSNTADKIIDEDADTIWSTNGDDRYVTLELEKPSTVIGTDIMFNPNSGRDARFTLEVSTDGKKYKQVYKGHGDGSVEGGAWETFVFNAESNIKFVRYHGNGSEISRWNAVKEIRIMVE